MRSVYRRDPCLGLGYGVSSFIAAVNVWAAGSEEQCRQVAGLLLKNRKVAVAHHELAHGNDMVGTEFEAMPGPDGRLLLNGRKEVVTNIRRADAVVMFARTDCGPGSRSHSQILVDKARIPDGRMRYLPRYSTVGMRGVQLGGMEFQDCPLPADTMVGPQGHGLETALKSFQVTRTTLVAMFTGILDTALRTTLRHLASRRLYGRPVTELPEVHSVLAATHADLLLCDAFSTVAARAIHLAPAETAIYSSAVKFFVSKVLMDAMHRLSTLLGAHFYVREGDHAIFQKLLRDNQLAGFGRAARAACQMQLLPQLPLLARRSWRGAEALPEELFRLDAELPPVPFERLAVSAGGRERLKLLAGGRLVRGARNRPQPPRDPAGRRPPHGRTAGTRRRVRAPPRHRTDRRGELRHLRPHAPLRERPGGRRVRRTVARKPEPPRPVPQGSGLAGGRPRQNPRAAGQPARTASRLPRTASLRRVDGTS
ncbi:acyl-CoA dehydrogenase family protein [Streptomyces sp. NPDC098085]|uniref:acyl-CoA dehydrogenase n=1 Tax=Streptomyces sp. NPDC098085 TaxID=3366094 RepID=UPI0038020AB8